MEGFGNNLLLVIRSGFMTERDYEEQVEIISRMLRAVWTKDTFCKAHELVDRNRITGNPIKIQREAGYYQLRPFRFLINKN